MSECIGAIATKDGWSFEEKRKTKHWLESLKDKYVWKPNGEQMMAMQVFLEHGCAAPDREASLAEKVLESLYQDLKKLMEE